MRVAIDATPAAVREPTGVAVYIDRLVRTLPLVDPETRYVSCYRLFRLARRSLVPLAREAPNASRALLDERVPGFRRPRADLYHGADIRLPERPRVPCVATIHDLYSFTSGDLDAPAFTAKRRAQVERAARAAALLLTHSEHVRHAVIERLSVAPERVRAVPLGVDPDFRPREAAELAPALARHGLAPGGYALAVGTISRRKNPLGAVRAVAQLRARGGPALALVFAGKDHDQAAEVRAEAARLAVPARLLGYARPGDLPALYAGARALLFLSHDEGFGLPVLEAYACGTPVVAARRGAIPEVAGAGAAWLVEPDDAGAAAEALAEAVAEGAARAARVRAGIERAAPFTWEETARRTAAAYRAALGAGGGG